MANYTIRFSLLQNIDDILLFRMNIALLGPQGSGKGTQGELLSEKTGMYYFDAGAHLREIAKTRPDIDQMVNKRGVLVPDELMYKIVRDYLIEKNKFDEIIFDGYPRSLTQWNLLTNLLSLHAHSIEKVFYLHIPEEESVKRLSARRMNPVNGEIYNLITNPPPPGVDVNTLLHREDDKPEAIKERLEAFRVSTEPLINKLKEEGKLVEINGVLPIEEIQKIIFSEISTSSD